MNGVGILNPAMSGAPPRRFLAGCREHRLWRNPRLGLFLNGTIMPDLGLSSDPEAVRIGWGQKPSGQRAQLRAYANGQACWLLEDGFLRSGGLGSEGAAALSLVVDDLGIYYDASRPSRLERLIAAADADPAIEAQVARALALIRRHRLSKYNHAPDRLLPASGAMRVLVIDQTEGDASVRLGGADHATFDAMLAAALAENTDAEIWVKTHPEAMGGNKRGYFGRLPPSPRIHRLAEDVSPLSLLEQMDRVYAVTSQMGFEALMLHKPVVCFGQPWYAGWGLTDDRHPRMPDLGARRPGPRTMEQLFAAAYLQYARYLHPETGAPGTLFDVIDHLAATKRRNDELRGALYCIGMSLWKRTIVAPFLKAPSNRVRFVRSLRQLERAALPDDARLVVWGSGNENECAVFAAARGTPLWRMEDGFLRSVGLGSDLRRPLSLVLDRTGMYYDPGAPSALEQWLAQGDGDNDDLARARRLRERLVALRLSKYNVGRRFEPAPSASGRRVILVPGQVEDDASIRFGSPIVRTNADLLRAVRTANPDAHIIFKPHPDVAAGNRRGAVPPELLVLLCDQVALDVDIVDCITAADEVHTMTSLSGFEALLHGKAVHCHGLPFYAGWGLTVDHLGCARRARALSLDMLVHGTLIHYPRYIDPVSLAPATPEAVVDLLQAARASRTDVPLRSGFFQKQWRKFAALAALAGKKQHRTFDNRTIV